MNSVKNSANSRRKDNYGSSETYGLDSGNLNASPHPRASGVAWIAPEPEPVPVDWELVREATDAAPIAELLESRAGYEILSAAAEDDPPDAAYSGDWWVGFFEADGADGIRYGREFFDHKSDALRFLAELNHWAVVTHTRTRREIAVLVPSSSNVGDATPQSPNLRNDDEGGGDATL